MTTATHAEREGDSVTFNKAPECEGHRLNYNESLPATHVMRITGNGFHYLCDDCTILFCDGVKPLGTGVGQRIVVNSRAKAEPPPPEPISTERPAKKAATKKAAPPAPPAPAVPADPKVREYADKRAASKKVAEAKKLAEAKAQRERDDARAKADGEKLAAAKERAARKEAMKAESPPSPPNLAEPSLQQEVQRTVVAPAEADKPDDAAWRGDAFLDRVEGQKGEDK